MRLILINGVNPKVILQAVGVIGFLMGLPITPSTIGATITIPLA
jgi:hypothetical protein